jgi:hypothetical protein
LRIVYLEHQVATPPPPFRTGEAGLVQLAAGGGFETDSRVPLSANSTHALIEHGVVAELNRLELQGQLGRGLDVLIPQACLAQASAVLYAADRCTYGRSYEFVIAQQSAPQPRQFRVRIDNREYQRTLARLQYLVTTASRLGHAVRVRI